MTVVLKDDQMQNCQCKMAAQSRDISELPNSWAKTTKRLSSEHVRLRAPSSMARNVKLHNCFGKQIGNICWNKNILTL